MRKILLLGLFLCYFYTYYPLVGFLTANSQGLHPLESAKLNFFTTPAAGFPAGRRLAAAPPGLAAGLWSGPTLPPNEVNYRAIRINEVLADVNPPVGLPAAEFIELYNNSNQTVNLAGWQYADAGTSRATLPAFNFTPGSYVILCRAADTASFRPYGPVLGLAVFPALNDGGDQVRLFSNTGKLIDQITYTPAWYRDARKANGGWSLELKNPGLLCAEAANWQASAHPQGGTPGRQNAAFSNQPDTQPPALLQAIAPDANHIQLTFSENLDSLTAQNSLLYAINPGLSVTAVAFRGGAYHQVWLSLAGNLQPGLVYEVTARSVRDCVGNQLSQATATVVLPHTATPGNIVINEVLFNPRSGGVDFVEIVNRSAKYLDVQGWQLGNDQPAATTTRSILSTVPLVMAPGQYLVFTTRPEVVLAQYPAANQAALLSLSRLPTYPDDQGTVLLLDNKQQLIDRFTYHEDMHYPLLNDVNGVSLERIRLQGDSSAANWHSAASTVGYATPGYQNSQYYAQIPASRFFSIEPALITPDDDGNNDFAVIHYRPEAAGYVTNITIYNAAGQEIKHLIKNELLGSQNAFRWDGLDNRGQKVPVGYYVLYIELFNLQGQVRAFKETVVVGAKF